MDGGRVSTRRLRMASSRTAVDRSLSGGGGDITLDWCIGPDIGLPAPDAVIFLDLDQDEAEKRGG